LSEENSVNVLTHFKNKKLNRNSLQKSVPLDKQVALFFSPCVYVILTQLQTQVTQDCHMLTLLSVNAPTLQVLIFHQIMFHTSLVLHVTA